MTADNGVDKPRILEGPLEFDPASGPPLRGADLNDFLAWAGGVPVGAAEVIRERIASARNDSAILDRLLEELWTLPVRDGGRHYLLLSTIGEFGDGRAAAELARFIWAPDERIAPASRDVIDGCAFGASTADVLKARAAEMLSYLRTPEATEETLRIAAEHPAPPVRTAAIDAYLYNHDDAPEEMERLRRHVRSGDEALVGLPRFTRETDRGEFERAVSEFYDRHPDRRPRLEREAAAGPQPRDER